jgi:D-glycero-D-manno-heptose 1,7-bisphosphate phosphatase
MGRPAVFLDRDGTINVDKGHATDVDAIELLPGATRAIQMLNEADMLVVVVTNQSIVARGLATEEDVRAMNDRLRHYLAEEMAYIDAFYYCPHHPAFGEPCDCRKPAPGMLLQAAEEHDLDLSRSFMVGDWWADIGAGIAAGTRTVLITGTGEDLQKNLEELASRGWEPDARVNDIREAVDWILLNLMIEESA